MTRFLEQYKKTKNNIIILEKIRDNIKKSINRIFSKGYIEEKRKNTKKVIEEVLGVIKEIKKIYKCNEIIEQKLNDKKR
jgi:hypothetical protein